MVEIIFKPFFCTILIFSLAHTCIFHALYLILFHNFSFPTTNTAVYLVRTCFIHFVLYQLFPLIYHIFTISTIWNPLEQEANLARHFHSQRAAAAMGDPRNPLLPPTSLPGGEQDRDKERDKLCL